MPPLDRARVPANRIVGVLRPRIVGDPALPRVRSLERTPSGPRSVRLFKPRHIAQYSAPVTAHKSSNSVSIGEPTGTLFEHRPVWLTATGQIGAFPWPRVLSDFRSRIEPARNLPRRALRLSKPVRRANTVNTTQVVAFNPLAHAAPD